MKLITTVTKYSIPYLLDEEGNLYNEKTNRTIKPFIDRDGYLRYRLRNKDGKKCSVKVHRLVAEHYVENPLNYPFVIHKNGNRTDNSVGNLEWADKSGSPSKRIKYLEDQLNKLKSIND